MSAASASFAAAPAATVVGGPLSAARRRGAVACAATPSQNRREVLLAGPTGGLLAAVVGVAGVTGPLVSPAPARAAYEKALSNRFPASSSLDGFVTYVPGRADTPALRAGTVNPDFPYRVDLPANWAQDPVANIASGNYCQPRCPEPWTESIFSSPGDGHVEIIVAPVDRLSPVPSAKLTDIGEPEEVLASLGQFLTGNFYESDFLVSASSETVDGETYYSYELDAPDALTGPHVLSRVSSNGELLVICKARGG